MQSYLPPYDGVTGSRIVRATAIVQRLRFLWKQHRHDELRDELARAELSGDLPELHALCFQAILAMAEDSELASDYLDMAEAVASSPAEAALVAEHRATHDLLRGDPFTAADRCLATLDHIHQTEGLWNHLLIALDRLGEVEAIDATLRRLARLDDECVARLLRLLLSEPDLCDVRARPAFRALLERRATR